MNTVLRHVVSLAAIAVGLFSGNAMGEPVKVDDVLDVTFSELDLELTEKIDEEGDPYWSGHVPVTSKAGSSLSYMVKNSTVNVDNVDGPSPVKVGEATYKSGSFILPLSQPNSGKSLEDEAFFVFLHHDSTLFYIDDEPEDFFIINFDVNKSYADGDAVINVNLDNSWVNFGDANIRFNDSRFINFMVGSDPSAVGDPYLFFYGADYTVDTLQAIHIEYSVTYYDVPSIPEPETYAMLLAGLGIVGAVARRHRLTRR
jgi:hypothetical protein